MFRNILKITIRNIRRHRGYTFINIGGLSMGLTCVLLILLYVRHELSYDRYHPDAARIYRVATKSHLAGRNDMTLTPAALAPALTAELPEIESAIRINKFGDWFVRAGEKIFKENWVRFTDANIFDIFSIPLAMGNPRTALAEPNCIIISEKTAKKYWGDSDPLDKTVLLTNLQIHNNDDNFMLFRVTGVFQEIPANTHFHADFIGSYSSFEQGRSPNWGNSSCRTYFKMKNGTNVRDLEAKIQTMILRNKSQEFENTIGKKQASSIISRTSIFLQPLTSVHLYSHLDSELESNGNVLYVMIFSAVAALVLIGACANFINLATAQAGMRVREVGIRKVIGSSRPRLVFQFLTESSVLTVVAFSLALVLANSLLPLFNKLSGRALQPNLIAEPGSLFAFLIVLILVSLLAGLYPAFVLSSSSPITVLKGHLNHRMRGRGLRRGLVIFQFTISLILTIGTLIIFKQIHYIHTTNLGFNKEQVLIVHNASLLGSQASAFKQELMRNPDVFSATVTSTLPLISYYDMAIHLEGQSEISQSTSVKIFYVDEDFVRTMGMEVVQGRDFSVDKPTDKFSVIINETAAKQFGWEMPLGKRFWYNAPLDNNNKFESRLFPVIGVVRDFNYSSIREEISPIAIFLRPSNGFTAVRLKTNHLDAAVGFVRKTWNGFIPGQPLEYSFLDERFESMYGADRMTGRTIGIFAILAILIGSMGIFGLAAFLAERRTKEIGIRKILGARIRDIVSLLVSEFVVLIVVSNFIAMPIAFFVMNKWLQGFAYRTNMGIEVFFAASILSLSIALLSVSFQSIKTATANPSDSLRYE
jgi:putative ABC transport system permease protein